MPIELKGTVRRWCCSSYPPKIATRFEEIWLIRWNDWT